MLTCPSSTCEISTSNTWLSTWLVNISLYKNFSHFSTLYSAVVYTFDRGCCWWVGKVGVVSATFSKEWSHTWALITDEKDSINCKPTSAMLQCCRTILKRKFLQESDKRKETTGALFARSYCLVSLHARLISLSETCSAACPATPWISYCRALI